MYKIIRDATHGYYRLSPVPTRDELKHYYDKEFYNTNYNKQINDSSKKVQEEESEFFALQHEDVVEILHKEAPGKRLIDIGCGYGTFLKFCQKRGFEVFGLDPSSDAVHSTQKMGIEAVEADIEDLKDIVHKKYDTAVMLNVFEHLREPYTILKDIREHILEDDGVLVIRVPNEFNALQTIANQAYNLKSWWVSAPQHINYFTIPHLVRLLQNNGFNVFLKEATFPLEMFILFGEQYVGNPEVGKIIHNKRVLFDKTLHQYDNAFKRQLYRSFAELGIGREIVVYAKKTTH
ncbi:MAG: class I SAM-dependent methyltransferase [Patescibacteria group bacterium]